MTLLSAVSAPGPGLIAPESGMGGTTDSRPVTSSLVTCSDDRDPLGSRLTREWIPPGVVRTRWLGGRRE